MPGLWGDRSFSILGLNVTWDQTTTILTAVARRLRVPRAVPPHAARRRDARRRRQPRALRDQGPQPERRDGGVVGDRLDARRAGRDPHRARSQPRGQHAEPARRVRRTRRPSSAGSRTCPATFVGALILGVSQAMVVALPAAGQRVRAQPAAGDAVRPAVRRAARCAASCGCPSASGRTPSPSRRRADDVGCSARSPSLVAIAAVGALEPTASCSSGSKGLVFAAITLSLVLLTGLSGPGVADADVVRRARRGRARQAAGRHPVDRRARHSPRSSSASSAGSSRCRRCGCAGIYLALLTLAFAILMDDLVFGNSARARRRRRRSPCDRPSIFGIDAHERAGAVRRPRRGRRASSPTCSSPCGAARSGGCSPPCATRRTRARRSG